MNEAPKTRRKPGRKSNAEKAAILAAQEQAGAGEQQTVAQDPVHVDEADTVRVVEPAKPNLSEHETSGLINEALWSHDMQEESVRFDSRNRKWTFRPDSRNNLASLSITCKRGPDERELLISNARFGADNVKEEVAAMIELLDGDLS